MRRRTIHPTDTITTLLATLRADIAEARASDNDHLAGKVQEILDLLETGLQEAEKLGYVFAPEVPMRTLDRSKHP